MSTRFHTYDRVWQLEQHEIPDTALGTMATVDNVLPPPN